MNRGYIRELLRKKRSPSCSVAMLHTGRCGSTVLGNMLADHSEVSWDSEVFESYMNDIDHTNEPFSVTDILNARRQEKAAKVYGFETKYLPQQHLSEGCIGMDLESYIQLLDDIGFKKFILLHRENYLKRAVSACAGRRSKTWHVAVEPKTPSAVHIDINSFVTGKKSEPLIELFKQMDRQYLRCKSLLAKRDFMEISYERDVLSEPIIAYRSTCDFLGLKAGSPVVSLARTNPFRLNDLIINWDEVSELLSGTKYDWMLED